MKIEQSKISYNFKLCSPTFRTTLPHSVMVSTADFESVRGGSNPSGATKVLYGVMVAYQISVLEVLVRIQLKHDIWSL